MSLKKISASVFFIFIWPLLVGGVVILLWSKTPYGRLDPRVTILLKIINRSENYYDKNLTVQQNRNKFNADTMLGHGTPEKIASIKNMTIPGAGGEIPIRIYTPGGKTPFPVVMYYHGGGWMSGNLETHDVICRALAAKTSAVVVAVDYRLAPEHKFPAGVNDCYDALVWASKNAAGINADADRIAVAGDSAGGNLAAVVALMARDRKGPRLSYQVLVYPGTDASDLATESLKKFGRGYLFTRADLETFNSFYVTRKEEISAPYVSPALAVNHKNLPPALIITAQFDPVLSHGEIYAKKLEAAGVPVTYHCYKGVVHAFMGMDLFLPQAGEATTEIAGLLKNAFSK